MYKRQFPVLTVSGNVDIQTGILQQLRKNFITRFATLLRQRVVELHGDVYKRQGSDRPRAIRTGPSAIDTTDGSRARSSTGYGPTADGCDGMLR